MRKEEFTRLPDVIRFVDWLAQDLPSRVFHLSFRESRFVPGGLDAKVTGVEEALGKYCWKANWVDGRTGAVISSDDWPSTKHSLGLLSRWLNESVDTDNSNAAMLASTAILKWGGVSGASTLLRKLNADGTLTSYLRSTRNLLAVNGKANQSLFDINSKSIKKFDSGLTKVHSIHAADGSPIYDTRVAATVSLLYCLYRETCPKSLKSELNFPCGSARGDQIRNPGELGFNRSKAFYIETPHEQWAKTQLTLGWIFSDLLTRNPGIFECEGDLAARMHALEAAFFVLGYDLRCFRVQPRKKQGIKGQQTKGSTPTGLVPTSHPFQRVIREYIETRRAGVTGGAEKFVEEMFRDKNPGLLESTRRSYLFPLRASEFDLLDASEESLDLLNRDPLSWLKLQFDGEGFTLPDERRYVCLLNAWLVGHLNRKFPKPAHIEMLKRAGFAGRGNGANVLLSVGRNVGLFFKLLDRSGMPIEAFDRFFCQDMSELSGRLADAYGSELPKGCP